MEYAYIRVSTRTQNIARQLEEIKKYGLPKEISMLIRNQEKILIVLTIKD